jgi:hypothetical protein
VKRCEYGVNGHDALSLTLVGLQHHAVHWRICQYAHELGLWYVQPPFFIGIKTDSSCSHIRSLWTSQGTAPERGRALVDFGFSILGPYWCWPVVHVVPRNVEVP